MQNDFDESVNVETILKYWDEIASPIAPVLDSKSSFQPIDVSTNPKVWPYLSKFDWWPRNEIEARKRDLQKYEPNILRDSYSHEYIWGQTRGTIHTACLLGDYKDNPMMVKAIWIQAFIRNLLTTRFDCWKGKPFRLSREVEMLFSATEEYEVEWHHAMSYILPLSYFEFGVLTHLIPENVGELIEMAVFGTMLCLAKYQLIEYYPKQRR